MSLGLVALLALAVQAQDFSDQPGAKSTATLRLEQVSARPGDTVWAGVHLVIPAPWHTYWVNHGGGGEAPSVKWQLPRGVTAGKIHWPLPKKHKSFGSIAYVYEHEVLLLVPLELAKDLKPGQREVRAVVKWLECTDETCVPGEKHVAAKFEVGAARVAGGDAALFTKWRAQLPGVMPNLKADWAGPVADNFWRPLVFRVPLKESKTEVEFFPYLDPKDEFTVQADVEVELGKSFVKLTHQVESVGKKWPPQVAGVLRVGGKSYEVVLKVGESVGSTDKPDSTFLLAPGPGFGEGQTSQLELLLDAKQAKPGQEVMAGVRFRIPEGWHIYHKDPGGPGLPPEFTWVLPKGVEAGEIQWPKHEVFEFGGEKFNGYHDEVMLLVSLRLAEDRVPGPLNLRVNVTWQECKDICVQGESTLTAKLVVADKLEPSHAATEIAAWKGKVPVPDSSSGEAKTRVSLVFDHEQAKAGGRVLVGVRFKIPDQWHISWRNPGDAGETPKIKWDLPEGITVGKLQWPTPEKQAFAERSAAYVYSNELMLMAPLQLSSNVASGKKEIRAQINWLECNEGCVSGEAVAQTTLMVGEEARPGTEAALLGEWQAKLPLTGEPQGLVARLGAGDGEGIKALRIELPAEKGAKYDFYPYQDDQYEVLAPTDTEVKSDLVALLKQVKKSGEDWPTQISGLLVKTDADNTVKSNEVTLQVGGPVGAKSRVTLLLDVDQARSGDTVLAGVHFKIPPKWHIFWKNPGDLGEAPKIQWQLPKGVSAGEVQWPQHELYEQMGYRQNVYHDEVMLIVPLDLSKDLKPGELQLSAEVAWQECEVACVQGKANVSASLLVGVESKPSAAASQITEWQGKVPASGDGFGVVDWSQLGGMLLLAFAGGLILNLMPCVLPVIALKVMGFVNQRKEEPGHARRLGIIYGLGVIFSFLLMAGLLLSVRAGAGGETWGMQMQNKWFLLFLTVLMTLVALNLFGVFEITLGGSAMTKADSVARKEGTLGAFANGMLMVALATPCLAPMLGTAIGFALTQPALVVVLMFATVAVGLALPYVILSFKPDWLRFLPQPGAWMESFKNAMGFPMLAAAIWLSTLAAGKLGEAGGLRVGILMVLVAMAAWIFGQFIQRGTSRRGLAGFFALAASGAAAACLFVFQDKLDWKPWSEAAVAEARAAGHPVMVDFTADWCLTCKLNKRSSIEIDSVRKKVESVGAIVFKGDFTDKNPGMAAFIKSFGRPGVPLVLVYSPNKDTKPQILPELLRPGLVLAALEKAAANSSGPTDAPDPVKPDQSAPKIPNPMGPSDISWGEWSVESVAKAQSKGMPVLVDFTADWCAPCKHIEKTAINVPIVRKKLAQLKVMALKADYTGKGKVILEEMNRFGRAGPPLVLVYPPKERAKPIVMPQVFTSKDLLKKLDQAVGAGSEAQKNLESAEASAKPRR